jgi:YgiT-type zinc finger domain-containing protein
MSAASIASTNPRSDSFMSTSEESLAVCSQCGSTKLQRTTTRSAFWEGDRLVVVEDIPAVVCADCGERHYDDRTVVLIDLWRGDGFPVEKARRQITVPVFALGDRLKGGGTS